MTFYGTPETDPAYFGYDPRFSLGANSMIGGLTYALIRGEFLRWPSAVPVTFLAWNAAP